MRLSFKFVVQPRALRETLSVYGLLCVSNISSYWHFQKVANIRKIAFEI